MLEKDLFLELLDVMQARGELVAGEDIEEAIAAIREINAKGSTASFDHLNESVTKAILNQAGADSFIVQQYGIVRSELIRAKSQNSTSTGRPSGGSRRDRPGRRCRCAGCAAPTR